MKGIIISGFPGIGKTTIAMKYQDRIIDLESSDFKWVYKDNTISNMPNELRKGEVNRRLNSEWPRNYIKAIVEATKKFDIVLIAQGKDIRTLLYENKIEFFICFPTVECKQEYLDRYISRGNRQAFVEKIKSNFETYVDLMDCPQPKLLLRPGQYLEDVLKEKGLI